MSWPVVVTIHNIVNIPAEAVRTPPRRAFTVEVRLAGHTGQATTADKARAILPFATFSSDEVRESAAGIREIRLDDVRHKNSASGSYAWRSTSPEVDIVLVVLERQHLCDDDDDDADYVQDSSPNSAVVVGRSATLHVSLRDVVERTKLRTYIVGTEMGQVGMSFCVDPADTAGYKARLEAFLRRHNPQGLHLVPSVVEVVPEVDTFTKLYRKYGLVDYDQRLRDFFRVYGPEYESDIPLLLTQWESREEELLRNLVLDNGPELADIDVHKRLTAFLAAHTLHRSDPGVASLLPLIEDTPSEAFEKLVSRFGEEPDPRTYLFPPTRYVVDNDRIVQPSHRYGTTPTGSNTNPVLTARRRSSNRTSILVSPESSAAPAAAANDTPPQGVSSEKRVERYEGVLAQTDTSPSPPHTQRDATDEDLDKRRTNLWERLVSCLKEETFPPGWVLHYTTNAHFAQLVSSLGRFSPAEVDALCTERSGRMTAALRQESVSQTDARYDAAVKEATSLLRLQQLQVQVMSVTSTMHQAHAEQFAARLNSAKKRHTERLVLLGDFETLSDIVRFGVSSGSDLSEMKKRQHPQFPCAVFLRDPCRVWQQPRSVCVLVCDVVVGRTYQSQHSGSFSLLDENTKSTVLSGEYDSYEYTDDVSGGPAVAVFSPKQVLPRLLLHCRVDPTLVPCPAHPTRPVEYYVADEHAFACSRCVIQGQYKGVEVLSVEEASLVARSRLSEIHRDAASLSDGLKSFDRQLVEEESAIASAPRHLEAQREIDRLRREFEEQVARIQEAVEQADRVQRDRISTHRAEIVPTLRTSEALTKQVESVLNNATPLQAVEALQRVEKDNTLDLLKLRILERMPDMPMDGVTRMEGQGKAQPRAGSAAKQTTSYYGLNESRVSGGLGGRAPVNKASSSRSSSALMEARGAARKPHNSSVSLLPTQLPAAMSVRSNSSVRQGQAHSSDVPPAGGDSEPNSASSLHASSHQPPPPRSTDSSIDTQVKESLSRGWSLLREGDVNGARRVWRYVAESVGDENPQGTRARAYISEALDKDYEAAGKLYARSLELDPDDKQTAYNYAVLLDAMLGRSREALQWYDRAADLGDHVASARAQQIRAKQRASR